MKFNRLTVENADIGFNRFGQRLWLCRCDCGTPTLAIASSIKGGRTKSCGCLQREGGGNFRHGQRAAKSRAYTCWRNMKSRCDNPSTNQYADYGGRGITYDPRWKKFENFFADMGDPPEGTSIDRIDNDGNYTKANCRWADKSTQRRNQRPQTVAGCLVWCEINGERLILADAVKKFGVVPYTTVVNRIHQGWPPERAVLTPYTRGFSHAPETCGKRYVLKGESLTLSEWSKRTGIGRVTLLKRIQRGVPLELALSTAAPLCIRRKPYKLKGRR